MKLAPIVRPTLDPPPHTHRHIAIGKKMKYVQQYAITAFIHVFKEVLTLLPNQSKHLYSQPYTAVQRRTAKIVVVEVDTQLSKLR